MDTLYDIVILIMYFIFKTKLSLILNQFNNTQFTKNKETTMNNKFGIYIKEKRMEKEIGLREMAELIDISPSYFNDIEKGRRNPPNLSKLKEISQILQLSERETDDLIDVASETRGEIPMDVTDYIKENDIVKIALRKARKAEERGEKELVEKAWRDFIEAIE